MVWLGLKVEVGVHGIFRDKHNILVDASTSWSEIKASHITRLGVYATINGKKYRLTPDLKTYPKEPGIITLTAT
jgi:hypothetical protein